jgi:NO-binding membrane sensor protein with MHYT domain
MQPTEPAAQSAVSVLWMLGIAVPVLLLLAAQVALGYGREARRARRVEQDARRFRRMLAAGGTALGSGIWAAMVLTVTSAPVGYTIGFHPLGLLVVWIGALLLGVGPLALAARNPSLRAVAGGGAMFGIGIPLLQVALMGTIDLEPGIEWGPSKVVMASGIAAIGTAVGLHIVFRSAGRNGHHRHLLRWAASGVVAIAVTLCLNLVLSAAALPDQSASLAAEELPAIVAAAIAGLAVLAGLAAGLVQLWLLRDARRRAPVHPTAPQVADPPSAPSRR